MTYIPQALLRTLADAKGDLLGASAADVIARLAVGTDGSTLVADAAQALGIKWGLKTLKYTIVTKAAAQAITTTIATFTMINFDTTIEDTPGWHDPVTNNTRITVDEDGVYLMVGQGAWANHATGGRRFTIVKDGATTLVRSHWPVYAGSSSTMPNMVATVRRLAATNYVEFGVAQDSGGNLNLEAFSAYSPIFAVALLGK